MTDDGTARVVWAGEMEPISKTDGPALVVYFVDKGAVLVGDAEGGDARHAFGVRGVKRTSGARTSVDGSKMGLGRVRRTGRRRRRGQCLV